MYESRDNPASFSTRSTIYLKNLEPYTNRIITNHSRALVNLRLKDMFSRRESPNRDSPPWSTPFLFDEQSALKGLNWLTPYTHLCFPSSTRNLEFPFDTTSFTILDCNANLPFDRERWIEFNKRSVNNTAVSSDLRIFRPINPRHRDSFEERRCSRVESD